MSLYETIRVLYYNARVIILACVIPTAAVIYFTADMEKKYRSSALIYTGIASGYSIESSEGQRIDYHVVNNAFDNLISLMKSRETLEEVGLRLLAKHLMLDAPNATIGSNSFQALQEFYPLENRTWVDTTDFEITLSRASRKLYEGSDPLIAKSIRGESGPYSLKALSKVGAKRIKSSDMVQLEYEFADAGIAKGTLDELLEVFVKRYKNLKSAETGNVVAYFEKRLAEIKVKLTTAEDRLTVFRSENRVINYGEQTKAIAIKKQNALEEYSSRKMNLEATQAALQKIEEKLEIRKNILEKNALLLNKKQELTQLTSQIAMYEASEGDLEMSEMINRQGVLRSEINNDLHDLFNFSNSKEGLPSKQLLNDWLSYLISVQKEDVQVKLFGKRLRELNAEYDRFAPLGSTIDRYEREIGVFEREFLEVLHGLNMAKLKQQNIQLSSALNILDNPKYPAAPQASKRAILVVVAFMVGFFGSVGGIIIQEMLDNTLREPVRAEELSGLPVVGVTPSMNKRVQKNLEIQDIALDQIIDRLNYQFRMVKDKPVFVVLGSTAVGTGKSKVAEWLKNRLEKHGKKVEQIDLKPNANLSEEIEALGQSGNDLVLIELPALAKGNINYEALSVAHSIILVERADRGWSGAHERIKLQLEEVLKEKAPQLLLNGVKYRFLEHVLGEVPGNNGSLKTIIKRALRFERTNSSLAS